MLIHDQRFCAGIFTRAEEHCSVLGTRRGKKFSSETPGQCHLYREQALAHGKEPSEVIEGKFFGGVNGAVSAHFGCV